MSVANALTEWARVLFTSLADAGVRDVVISPGSRSTPFIVAAAAEPRLRCHDSIDERAAAFFALGQTRISGRPSAVLCTSGTAAAHYYPAVVEAGLAYLPLIVVTADRPLDLQDCGAPQTIDQLKLYGDQVRRFYELGGPDPSPDALTALRRLAQQAVHYSCWPVPGAVHLNVRARKPLEPRAAVTAAEQELHTFVDSLLSKRPTSVRLPRAVPDATSIAEVVRVCRGAERGLIVAGPSPLSGAASREMVFDLARRLQYPLLAEATSQLRFCHVPPEVPTCDAFDVVLHDRAFVEQYRPGVVVQIGSTPTSGAWERFQAGLPNAMRVVVAPHGWPDPAGDADVLLIGDPQLAVHALLDALDSYERAPGSWTEDFRHAADRAWGAVDRVLGDDRAGLREGHVVQEVLRHVPAGSILMVGNSLPVRAVDTYGRTGAASVAVLSQRGANGIECLVAGAAGTASASDSAITLILGDVSLIHDLGSLGLAARSRVPLVLVVPQNHGGRIFEQLPLAKATNLPAGTMEHITTPHDVSFEGASRVFGLRYDRVESLESLRRALVSAYEGPGGVLIEAVVPEHGAAEDLRRVCEGVAARG